MKDKTEYVEITVREVDGYGRKSNRTTWEVKVQSDEDAEKFWWAVRDLVNAWGGDESDH